LAESPNKQPKKTKKAVSAVSAALFYLSRRPVKGSGRDIYLAKQMDIHQFSSKNNDA